MEAEEDEVVMLSNDEGDALAFLSELKHPRYKLHAKAPRSRGKRRRPAGWGRHNPCETQTRQEQEHSSPTRAR